MKPVIAVIFVTFFSLLYSSEFEKKAESAAFSLVAAQAELASVRAEFDKQSLNIQKLKGRTGFFSEALLKRSLSKANRFAYRVNFLQAEIQSITEDLVTYSFILVDDYSQQIKKCLKEKCPDIDRLKAQREKHLEVILRYSPLEADEKADPSLLALKDKEAVLDVKDELDKTIIRLEQRIFILEEERAIMSALKEKEKTAKTDELIKKMKDAINKLKADLKRFSFVEK